MAGKIDTHKLHVDDPSYGANEECTEDGYFCEDPECLSKYPRHTFSNRSKLNKHINGHRKPFTCTQPGCLKSFSQKQNVDRHARRHHHEASSAIEFYHCTTDECKYASTGSRRKRFARIDQVREHIKDYGHYGPHSPMQREKRPGSPLPANQAVIYYIEKWTSKKSSQIYRVALSLCFHTSKTKLWHLDDTRDIFIRVPDSRLSLLPSDGHQCTVSETCYYQSFWPTSIPITLFKSDSDRREHEHRAHSLGAQAISSTEYQILEADNGFCGLPFAQTLEDMLASECLPPESMFPLDIAHETSYIFNFEESSIKNIGVAAEEASMSDSRYHQSFGEELTLSDQRFVESYHSAKSHQDSTTTCETCGKHFKRKGDLLRHTHAIHQGQTNYSCKICFRTYSRKDKVLEHLRNVHGKDRETSKKLWEEKSKSSLQRTISVGVAPGETLLDSPPENNADMSWVTEATNRSTPTTDSMFDTTLRINFSGDVSSGEVDGAVSCEIVSALDEGYADQQR